MAENSWKKIAGGLGAAALVIAGSYFGLEGTDSTTSGNTDTSTDSGQNGNQTTGQPTGKTKGQETNKPANDKKSNQQGSSSSDTCPVTELPEEADEVIDRILADQDHIYSQHDGKHFGNYENVLPKEKSSYYREYTVETPGINHRGARRIVVGGGTEDDPDVWYYTDDHFESFCEIPDAEE